MWNDLVGMADGVAGRVLFRFVELFWQHPVVGALFLVGFLILAVLLWVEVLKDGSAARRPMSNAMEPIRLRR